METIEQMRERHKREERELQESCEHKNLSKWMDEWWAIAHGTGFQVKTCEACGKIIKKRTACHKCGKVTEEYQNGLGTHSRPYGSHYCPSCLERTEEEVKGDEKSQKQMEWLGHGRGKWI